jgi:hypothetical protein
MPHAKICLEERQFTRPSPALRYAKIPRRKLSSASEPMLFGLPIQYGVRRFDDLFIYIFLIYKEQFC